MPPTPTSSTSSAPTNPLPLNPVAIPVPLPPDDYLKHLRQIPDVWLTYWFDKSSGWIASVDYTEASAVRKTNGEMYAQVFHIPKRAYEPPTPPPAVSPAP